MNLALFGGFDRRPFGPGWTKETLVAVLGGGEVDLTESPPEGEGRLRVVAFLGGVEIIVPTLKGYRRTDGNSWNWFISEDPKIAYVRLTQFTPESADKLRDLLTDLLKQGMTGLVFDLRFNPGGRLDEAIKIIDLFIEEGVIVKTKGRSRPEQVATAKPEGTLPRFHMVVLVNEHSASASEVVAGSLLDNRRAVIIGERTYGKGSVQEPIPLDGGGDLKLTVAYYYLPSGRLVHRLKDATDWGVEPQIIVKMDEAQQRAQVVAGRVQHITELLAASPPLPAVQPPDGARVVTYHSSCHLRAAGVSREPRDVLRRLPGARYVEMADADRCAGGAGTFLVKNFPLSQQIFERKRRAVTDSGAGVVATSCPACMIRLRAGLNDTVRVAHVAQLADEAEALPQPSTEHARAKER